MTCMSLQSRVSPCFFFVMQSIILNLICCRPCSVVLNDRKENPIEKHDLLYAMMHDKDPRSGKTLTDDAIVRNVSILIISLRRYPADVQYKLCTFLVAGERIH